MAITMIEIIPRNHTLNFLGRSWKIAIDIMPVITPDSIGFQSITFKIMILVCTLFRSKDEVVDSPSCERIDEYNYKVT